MASKFYLVVVYYSPILPFALMNHVGLPQITSNLLWTSFYYALANILYIVSLQIMDISALSPLFNFRTIFSVILGVLMLGEKISPWQIVLIGIIFVFGILVNVDEKLKLKAFFRPALVVVMIFLFVLSIFGIYTNLAIAEQGYWIATFWSMVFAQIIYLFTIPLFWKDLKKTPIKKYSGLLYMSLASAGGTLAANVAYASNVGISSVIISLPFSLIFAIILSFLSPKLLEHHKPLIYVIRVVGALIMLAAALQLSK